ncbi:MAG TPA: tRNA (adenosine(37)-N6)-dimethylallyltransferase MiaA [Bacteroidales bacterium]|nr:tRNA (adenosine(37)-N6)-dimethylallyltransferase MiaA [Bacteroidales bacterium]
MNTPITILGPTASGKTRLAALVANRKNGEIISADSRQVYRGMNLGTGKDYDDYIVDGQQIPYHLVDISEPGEEYNLFRYQQDFLKAFNNISSRNKTPLICGGTGLYLEAVLTGYKLTEAPKDETLRAFLASKTQDELNDFLASLRPLHNTTDTLDRERTIRAIEVATYAIEHEGNHTGFPGINSVVFGISYERENLRKRITQRLQARLESGMIEEVEQLIQQGITHEKLAYYGLEYRYISEHLAGKISFDEMFKLLNTAIHQFAKRQMTWFRRMERKGLKINWLQGESGLQEKLASMLALL